MEWKISQLCPVQLARDAHKALEALAGCWWVTDGSWFLEVVTPCLVPHAMTLLSKWQASNRHFCRQLYPL